MAERLRETNHYSMKQLFTSFFLLLFLTAPSLLFAQQKAYQQRREMDEHSILRNFPARSIGPVVQGGRVTDIEVVPGNPLTYYVGFASGGIFKTTDNGITFRPVFDDIDALGIGDFALAPSDPDRIYAGTGEKNSSRSSYAGSGLYRSDDGGETWTTAGLSATQHISRVLVDPEDPDHVWVAAIGALYSNNPERGVFVSSDGGKTWEKTLYVNDSTGVIDLVLDPSDPSQLWAASWERTRKAWSFKGDGPGSSIYRSQDGGKTWDKTVRGFPQGDKIGRIGLAVSPSRPERLYALLDNQNTKPEEKREEDEEALEPKDFLKLSVDDVVDMENKKLERFLRNSGYPARYTAVRVKQDLKNGVYEPRDIAEYFSDADEELYNEEVIGAELYRSDNGGDSWERVNGYMLEGVYFTYGYYFGEVRVAPDNADEVYVFGVPLLASYDGGKSFARIDTAGDVHVDHQDLWIDPANSDHFRLGNDGGLYESYDGGAEWRHINNMPVGQFYTVSVDMNKPYNVYGGLQDNGSLRGPSNSVPNRSEHWTQLFGGDGMFVTPDPRNSDIVYTGFQFGNYFRLNLDNGDRDRITPTHDIGDPQLRWNWRTPLLISPHNPDILYMGAQRVFRTMDGGKNWTAISDDLTRDLPQGNIPYSTISTMTESPLEFGLLLVGTDDGRVQRHDDNGWTDISAGLPEGKWVSYVFTSPFDKKTFFVAMNGYREDDFSTYIYKSSDNGKTWTSLKGNLPNAVVNVLIQDPVNPQLLYVGTDNGLYVSRDGGEEWSYASEVPNVAVYDLTVHPRENELVIATHGRSMYVMDVAPLQQLKDDVLTISADSVIRYSARWGKKQYEYVEAFLPEYRISYYVPEAGEVQFEIRNEEGIAVSRWTQAARKGFNTTRWDVRQPEVKGTKKTPPAEFAGKGIYSLVATAGKVQATRYLEIK